MGPGHAAGPDGREPAACVRRLRTDRRRTRIVPPFAIKLLTIRDGLVAAVTGFVHLGSFDRFVPPSIPPLPGAT
jgi:hypothetical protein